MTMMAASNATLSNVKGAVIVALSRYRRPAQEKETSCLHAANAESFAPYGEGGRSEFSIRVGGNEVAAGVERIVRRRREWIGNAARTRAT